MPNGRLIFPACTDSVSRCLRKSPNKMKIASSVDVLGHDGMLMYRVHAQQAWRMLNARPRTAERTSKTGIVQSIRVTCQGILDNSKDKRKYSTRASLKTYFTEKLSGGSYWCPTCREMHGGPEGAHLVQHCQIRDEDRPVYIASILDNLSDRVPVEPTSLLDLARRRSAEAAA